MARILILIVLAWILYRIFKHLFVNANKQQPAPKSEEEILQCAQCGCHVPEDETKLIHGQIICNNPECNKAQNGD
jgi:formylmethanofuran dehydrogenase subunit E